MSLDVYLISDTPVRKSRSGVVCVRRNGQTIGITEEEWYQLYPDREPVRLVDDIEEETNEVFHANITHNLGKMANAAGIYTCLWRPEEENITHAHQLISPLALGLSKLIAQPKMFKEFNPENGWGSYDTLVGFVSEYLKACIDYPLAKIEVSR